MENKPPTEVAEQLTDKNRSFIFHLVHGRSESGSKLTVYEAYQKAGYDGSIHAAYQLKSRLEREVMAAEVNRGASKADIFKQIADLMELPVTDSKGNVAAGISVTNKIKLLQLAVKAHEAVEPQAPRITAFQINLGGQPAAPNAHNCGRPNCNCVIVETEVVKDAKSEG